MEGSNTWWPMEGSNIWWPMEGSNALWPMESSNVWWPMEGSNAWWLMEGEGEAPFHLFPLSLQKILLKPSFFPFDFKVLLYHGFKLLLMHFFPFLWLINYNCASQYNKYFTHSLLIWFWLKISFHFLEIMASRMATSYGASSCTSEWRTSFEIF